MLEIWILSSKKSWDFIIIGCHCDLISRIKEYV